MKGIAKKFFLLGAKIADETSNTFHVRKDFETHFELIYNDSEVKEIYFDELVDRKDQLEKQVEELSKAILSGYTDHIPTQLNAKKYLESLDRT